jgi:hypothetical protein
MLRTVSLFGLSCAHSPARAQSGQAYNMCAAAALLMIISNAGALLLLWPLSRLHNKNMKRWDAEAAEFEKKKATTRPLDASESAASVVVEAGASAGAGTGLGASAVIPAAQAATPASGHGRSATGGAAIGPLSRPVLEWSRDDVYTWAITSRAAGASAVPGLGLAADIAAKLWSANVTGAFLISSTPEELGQRCLAAGLQLSVVSTVAEGVATLKCRTP